MNIRQQRFADAVLNGMTGSEAYAHAGYKARGNAAETNAARLLRNAQVAAYVRAVREKATMATELTVERTLREIARLAYLNPKRLYDADGNLLPVTELDDDTAAALSSVEVQEEFSDEPDPTTGKHKIVSRTRKVKLWDKRGSLELAAKHLGLLKDKLEVTGENGGPVKVVAGIDMGAL
jgi:phage terminase small subunit